MADPATIASFFASLKAATDIAKAIRGIDLKVQNAELNLKLADLLGSLADARIAAAELQESLQEKEKEIERLNEAVRLKAEVIKSSDAYFLKDASGKPSGEPFCVPCWEAKKELFHLTHAYINHVGCWICPHCKNTFPHNAIYLPG
jgi:hypothetical protein